MMKCGIDPGRFKIGIAFSEEGELLFSAIIPKKEEDVLLDSLKNKRYDTLSKWRQEGKIESLSDKGTDKIFLGDGTSSDELKDRLAGVMEVELVSEYETTLKARDLYWKLHPPRGLWKLVPTSLRLPPRDIDDLAAWAIINLALTKL